MDKKRSLFHRRILPPLNELEGLLSFGHGSEPRHRGNEFLVQSCNTCRHIPRTFHLTIWWVQGHGPLWKALIDDLPQPLQKSFTARWEDTPRGEAGAKTNLTLALAWCIREADHWQSLKNKLFIKELDKEVRTQSCTTWEFLDLTYLPNYELGDLTSISAMEHLSSVERRDASTYWSRGGVTRYGGTITSQGFWTACAGPLAVRLRHHVKGRTWDEKKTVPRALWKRIIELWHLRYPDRELPCLEALGRRISRGFSL